MRERIRYMVRSGFSDKEIAAATRLSVSGVKFYVAELKREFGLYGSADARRLVARLWEAK